jgi:putative ABC transport system permease protein
MKAIVLAWKNLFDKPWQLVLSLLLFSLGVSMIGFLILLNKQVKSKFDNNQVGIDMVIGAKGSPLQMVLCNMFHIDNPTGNIKISEAKAYFNPKHPLIELTVPLSLGDSYRNSRIVGTNKGFQQLYGLEVKDGKWYEEDFEVCIGQGVADKLRLKIGDTFDSSHGFNDDDGMTHEHEKKFKVVGLLKGSGTVADQLILCSPNTVWAVHDHGGEGSDSTIHSHESMGFSNENLALHPEESITSLLVRFRNRTSIAALNFPRAINENTGLLAVNPVYEINRLYSMLGVGFEALRILAYVIVFVSGFSIFISLFNSLRARKYELSLMRVMGASPITLFSIIILEGLIIAIIGYGIGILLSHFGMYFMASGLESSYKYSFSPWQFYSEEIYLFIGSLVLGFIAAFIPAVKAYQTNIHQVLSER